MAVSDRRIAGMIERHLGADADDELYAKCMTSICEGYPPDCSYHHTCMHDGDCFKKSQDLTAARMIEALAKSETDNAVKRYLTAAANAIRGGKIHIGADLLPFHQPE